MKREKGIFTGLSVAAFGFLLCSLAWAQDSKRLEKVMEGAKGEGKVRVGLTVRWMEGGKPGAKKMVEAFEARYPFVKVDYERVGGAREREKLLTELAGGKVPHDVTVVSEPMVPTLLRANLFETVDWRSLGVHPQHVHADGFGVNYRTQVYGIAYNRKLVPDNIGAKLTWDDCVSPKWKGKVVVDVRPRHLEIFYQPQIWGREKTLNHARQLAANQTVFDRSRSQSMRSLEAGEYSINCGAIYFTYYDWVRAGAVVDVGFTLAEPVPVNMGDVVFIPRGARYPNAAKLWIVWSLSEEGQGILDEVEGSGSPVFPITQAAKMTKGKKVAWYEAKWRAKAEEILKEIIQATGLPVVR